jgi:hypothetical protein
MTKATKKSTKLTEADIVAEVQTLKSEGFKVGMMVQNRAQKGRKGKILEIAHEEGAQGKNSGGRGGEVGWVAWGACAPARALRRPDPLLFSLSFSILFFPGKSPMIVYHQKNKDGKDMQYRNRPSLVTAEVDED